MVILQTKKATPAAPISVRVGVGKEVTIKISGNPHSVRYYIQRSGGMEASFGYLFSQIAKWDLFNRQTTGFVPFWKTVAVKGIIMPCLIRYNFKKAKEKYNYRTESS